MSKEDKRERKKKIAEANSLLALDLYSFLKKPNENLFFSPISVYTAFSMVYTGACNLTATQIKETLYIPFYPEQFHTTLMELLQTIKGYEVKDDFKLHIANLFVIKRDFHILNDYLEIIEGKYNAKIWELDDDSAIKINAWVLEQTHGKINGIIDSNSIREAKFILVNTIYFKGKWEHLFRETKENGFNLIDGNQINVPMMQQTNIFGYLETDKLQVLEMVYKRSFESKIEQMSMVIFLPKSINGLLEFEEDCSLEHLLNYTSQLNKQEVEVFIPKFHMEKEYDLRECIMNLGIVNAFNRDADFSGMVSSPKGLFIDTVKHKSYIDVNEEGTEAAAVTFTSFGIGAPIKREPPPVFRADHPFFFLIRTMQTNTFLFIGKVMNPHS